MSKWIKNFDELASTPNRSAALKVIEAGLNAVETESVIKRSVSLNGDSLRVFGNEFDLSKYKSVNVIGFGKASCKAAGALEKIIGPRIKKSAVVSAIDGNCKYIKTYKGTHPHPSLENVKISEKIYKICEDCTEEDLVIVIVSGGGSALLCYPESEAIQGKKLYESFLNSGGTIKELNTIRKHISLVKGGGLAKALYPATVVGLLFSDVPGDKYNVIASGPTCREDSTVEDAQKIIDKYKLGDFELMENPKEDKYFHNVHNFLLVSNDTALGAMKTKAQDMGFDSEIVSSELYEFSENVVKILKSKSKENKVTLAGGETKLIVDRAGGEGGRNIYLSLSALGSLDDNQLFISFASDGQDNGPSAGAIVDKHTLKKAKDLKLDAGRALDEFLTEPFFKKTKDLILTGKTEINVSDLILLLERKYEDR